MKMDPKNVRQREWRKANPDKCAEYERKRKNRTERQGKANAANRKRYADSPLVAYRIAQLDRQDGLCGICGTRYHGGVNWHVDHDARLDPRQAKFADPVSYRGVLCLTCNARVVAAAESNPYHRRNMPHVDEYLTVWEAIIRARKAGVKNPEPSIKASWG